MKRQSSVLAGSVVLSAAAGFSDATVEVAAGVLRRVADLVDQLARAVLADAAAAEIVARTLLAVLLDQRAVDQRVDALADRPARRLAAVHETRA